MQVQFTQNFHCFGRVITTTSWLTSLQERKFSYFIPQMLELVILVPVGFKSVGGAYFVLQIAGLRSLALNLTD